MPEFKERPKMDKPKARTTTIPPKQAARILSEKYRKQLDQRPEGSENEATDATDKVEGAGRQAVGEVTSHRSRPSCGQTSIKQRGCKARPTDEGGKPENHPTNPLKTKATQEQVKPRQPLPGTPRQRTAPAPATPGKDTTISSGLTRPQEAGRQAFVSQQQSKPPAAQELPIQLRGVGGPAMSQEAGRQTFSSHQRIKPRGQLSASGGSITAKPSNVGQRSRWLKERSRTVFKSKASAPGKPPGSAPKAKSATKATNAVKQIAQQRMRHQMVTKAKQTTKATASMGRKIAVSVTKAVVSLVGSLVGLLGGGVLLVILIFVIAVAAVVNTPFGLFFSEEQPGPGSMTPREAMAQLNAEYAARIEILKAGSYDGIEMSGQPADWRDILAVFAVKTAGADDGVDVATLDADRMAHLRAVYWDMTTITSWVETIDHDGSDPDDDVDDSWTEYILHITVTCQTADKAADSYGFTPDQRSLLAELQAPENNDFWVALLYGASAADSQIVAVALAQIGNVGGEPYWSWYGYTYHVNWCACFASWCANECGYLDSGVIPKFSNCSLGSRWFQSRGSGRGTI